jgi:hypothetical protein
MLICLVTFISKHDRFRAEDLCHHHGFTVESIPPPVWIRTNCDYAIRFDVSLKAQLEKLFTQHEIRVEQWITESEDSVTLADRLKKHLVIGGNVHDLF